MAEATRKVTFSADQRKWYERACACLNADRLKQNLVDLVSIHSPTGAERKASEFMADYMRKHLGGRGFYQPINELTGNAVGEIRGSGGGAGLLIYAPIDTHIDADPERDVPWVGPEIRRDMLPQGSAEGDVVLGLGAANPKGMVSTLTEVAVALYEAEVPLVGDLYAAFAGGGMPVNISYRGNYGVSDGLYHLLTRGVAPDFAIIMKPWYVVFAEEPGLCWFKVTVRGTMGYSGIPRGTPGYRNSIVPTGIIIQELEDWIPKYTKRNTFGQVTPEGKLAALRAGWPDKPAFPSAASEIYLDLRCSPYTTPGEVRAQFAQAMREIAARHPDIEFDWEMIASQPGGKTDTNNWIIQSGIRGWEHVEGRPHGEPPQAGGQTDGAMIRRLGIPCARIGYPWPPEGCPKEYLEGLGGMGFAWIPDFMRTARVIMYAAIDTLTRRREELGL
jgi:acetylornithine deacetylase/succinyl-diaminopimelate desuccinylase-like protein